MRDAWTWPATPAETRSAGNDSRNAVGWFKTCGLIGTRRRAAFSRPPVWNLPFWNLPFWNLPFWNLPVAAVSFWIALICVLPLSDGGSAAGEPWRRHTIDASSRGADGVRLADVNQDGYPDIATGWEEGGRIRICLNPGPKASRGLWPSVTVGEVKSPEDAVFVDLDQDGAVDVVSCCEGKTRTVFFHWAPKSPTKYLQGDAWTTAAVPATLQKQSWMFALPLQIDARHGVDLVLGAKGKGAEVGWLQAPADSRNLAGWKWHPLYRAGWIMSLEPADLDHDGDTDILVSDRKGARRGVLWLENPGADAAARGAAWNEHRIGGGNHEVMFLTQGDLDADGRSDVVAATRGGQILWFSTMDSAAGTWSERAIENPHGTPHGKAVSLGDIDLDGTLDLIHSANTGGNRQQPGVVWMSRSPIRSSKNELQEWEVHDISGPQGVKFDLIQTLDLDQDGDLDVITCEERDNLGVFWYENPTK
jgi:hypothetical protein